MAPTVEKIGRYEIVSELGRGAMGLVYRAVDPNIGRTVALKTMRLDVHGMDHDEMLRRFKNEARAAGLMSHPNIVTIYDADEVDGLFYIAMEYLEGQTIQSLVVQKRTLPADQIVEIAKQVCTGLDYAHRLKVIHRDIKPANIMITPENVAKIMDFGISKSVGSMTSSGQVLGTPNYMAPEQVKGFDLDGRADLFSFGVVLYEMATGERPFSGQNVTTIIYKIVNENPAAPCELEPTIHPGLSAVILRCLSKNPEERYQSGADLARDLENYRSIGCDGDATSVLPVQAPSTSRMFQTSSTGALRSGTLSAADRAQANGGGTAAAVAPAMVSQTQKQPTNVVSSTVPLPPARKIQKIEATIAIVFLSALLALAGVYKFRHRFHAPSSEVPPPAVAQIQTPAAQPVTQTPSQENLQPQENQPAVPDSTGDTSGDSKYDKSAAVKKAVLAHANRAEGSKVEIRFTSEPEGAFVQFDGSSSEAWITPFAKPDVTPGTHEVVFAKQGYATETRTLEIGPKNASYTISLVPVTTALALSSTPSGANIEVDGRDTGKVTPAQVPVAEGQHKIVLRLDGYRWAGTTANVPKGQIFQFQPVLNPSDAPQAGNTNPVTTRLRKFFGATGGKGMIDFVTDPPGAKIFVQGRPTQIATPAHAPFPPGDYRIELREPGYKPAQRTVHVDAGEIAKIVVTLEPK